MRILKAIIVIWVVFSLIGIGVAILHNMHEAQISKARSIRRYAAQELIDSKLNSYESANGRYPESLNSLSFTNTPEERDLNAEFRKFSYLRNEHGGYRLTYDADGVFQTSEFCIDTNKVPKSESNRLKKE